MDIEEKNSEGEFGIELEKYFKFNSSHFVAYKGYREPLHGHNYKVSVKIIAKDLNDNYYVTDFDNIKSIMNNICNGLKHCLLLPSKNEFLEISEKEGNIVVKYYTIFLSLDAKITLYLVFPRKT